MDARLLPSIAILSLSLFGLGGCEGSDSADTFAAETGDTSAGTGDGDGDGGTSAGTSAGTGDGDGDGDGDAGTGLSQVDTDNLVRLREEEKFARDVYLKFGETYSDMLFVGFAGAEGAHMNAIGNLLDKYGLEDPIVDDTAGVFTDPMFKDLYDQAVADGSVSHEAALRVGASIEEFDLIDVETARDASNEEPIRMTYNGLLCATRNHLRGFVGALETMGVVYVPLYLDAETYSAIMSTDSEQC